MAEEIKEKDSFFHTVYHTMQFIDIKAIEISGKWLRVTYNDGDVEEIEME